MIRIKGTVGSTLVNLEVSISPELLLKFLEDTSTPSFLQRLEAALKRLVTGLERLA